MSLSCRNEVRSPLTIHGLGLVLNRRPLFPPLPRFHEWITVRGAKRSRKPSPTNTSAVLQLEKRYKVLENLEEASIHTVHVPPSTSSLRSSHSQVKVPRCNPERPSPPVKPAVSIRPTSRQITNPVNKPIRSPSTLVMGSSMVRHVSIRNAETFCYPRARVVDLNSKLPLIINKHSSASTVIVHIGSNDIKLQQSEKLRDDFKSLINTLLDTGKQCAISGPFPSPRYTDIVFSRVRQLHIWLKGYCCVHKPARTVFS